MKFVKTSRRNYALFDYDPNRDIHDYRILDSSFSTDRATGMRKLFIFFGLILLAAFVWFFMLGSGGLTGRLKISGWYAVDTVDGYEVVCFTHAVKPIGNCIPKSQLGVRK